MSREKAIHLAAARRTGACSEGRLSLTDRWNSAATDRRRRRYFRFSSHVADRRCSNIRCTCQNWTVKKFTCVESRLNPCNFFVINQHSCVTFTDVFDIIIENLYFTIQCSNIEQYSNKPN